MPGALSRKIRAGSASQALCVAAAAGSTACPRIERDSANCRGDGRRRNFECARASHPSFAKAIAAALISSAGSEFGSWECCGGKLAPFENEFGVRVVFTRTRAKLGASRLGMSKVHRVELSSSQKKSRSQCNAPRLGLDGLSRESFFPEQNQSNAGTTRAESR